MSIRHMEDLKSIRPRIFFMIENYDELFRDIVINPTSVSSNQTDHTTKNNTQNNNTAEQMLSDMLSNAMVIDNNSNNTSASNSRNNSVMNLSGLGLNLSLNIGGSPANDTNDTNLDTIEADGNSGNGLFQFRPNLLVSIPTSANNNSTSSAENNTSMELDTTNHTNNTGVNYFGGNFAVYDIDKKSSASTMGTTISASSYTDADWKVIKSTLD